MASIRRLHSGSSVITKAGGGGVKDPELLTGMLETFQMVYFHSIKILLSIPVHKFNTSK